MRALIWLAFFCSGFSSLVLENMWVRNLTLLFGGSTLAIVTVLTTFMGGLALGSYLGGRWSLRIQRPVRVYGMLELGVALYALLLPWLFAKLPLLVGWLPYESPFLLRMFVRFIACGLLLLFPTTLMGATLPVLSRFLAQESHSIGKSVGALYSINTFGAVGGTLLSGFVLLPWLGHHITLLGTAGTLCTLALLMIFLPFPALPPLSTNLSSSLSMASSPPQTPENPHTAQRRLILICIAFTGATAMACQVLWARALNMIIGSSTYAFTLVLGTFLIGLAGGAAWGAWLSKSRRSPAGMWSSLLLLTALCVGLGTSFFDQLPRFFLWLMNTSQLIVHGKPVIFFSVKASVAAIPVLLPAFLMGTFFPLALELYHRNFQSPQHIGQNVGTLYAANTAGSILGSVLVGFLFIPQLGLRGSLLLCMFLYIGCAGALCLFLPKSQQIPRWGLGLVLALLTLWAPRWNLEQMSSGHFRLRYLFKNENQKPKTLFYKEGISATVAVQAIRPNDLVLKINGKPDASSMGDDATQLALAVFPLGFHINPKDVMIIGWGSGMTVGAALQFPLRSLLAVELEPAVLQASRFFDPWNYRPRRDPRLHIALDDGRYILASSKRTFDVIISEPSNPWISGISNLFTVEFFRQTRAKLKPNGIFCQWLQLYNISVLNLLSVLKSIHSVYPHVAVFESDVRGGDSIILASSQPLQRDIQTFQRLLQNPRIGSLLRRMMITDLPSFVLRFLFDHTTIEKLLAQYGSQIPFNTDDRNILEYFGPFDLLGGLHRKESPQQTFAPHSRSIHTFFQDRGAFLSHQHHPELWFGLLIKMLFHGLILQAQKHYQALQKEQPKAPFLPKMGRLIQLFQSAQDKPSPPLFAQPLSPPTYEELRIQQGYSQDPISACLSAILPTTRQKQFEQTTSARLWYYIGACFTRIQKYPDALYAFHQYLDLIHKAQKTLPTRPIPTTKPSPKVRLTQPLRAPPPNSLSAHPTGPKRPSTNPASSRLPRTTTRPATKTAHPPQSTPTTQPHRPMP